MIPTPRDPDERVRHEEGHARLHPIIEHTKGVYRGGTKIPTALLSPLAGDEHKNRLVPGWSCVLYLSSFWFWFGAFFGPGIDSCGCHDVDHSRSFMHEQNSVLEVLF